MGRIQQLFGTRLPWMQAPMYHLSGSDLAIECSKSGMLGMLAVQDPIRMRKSLLKIQQSRISRYGCNLFIIPDKLSINQPKIPEPVEKLLADYRKELDLPLNPVLPQDSYKQELESQLEIVKEFKVPLLVFTFGIPDSTIVKDLKNRGIKLISSCTSVNEALESQEKGMDAVILQGVEAGGHRTSIQLPQYGETGIFSLIQNAKKEKKLKIPVIAAGGITNGQAIQSLLELGADGVSIGSLFLTSSECNTPKSLRKMIHDSNSSTTTVLSRCFTGRPARMLPNRFYSDMMAVLNTIPGGIDTIPWNFYARDIFGRAARMERPDLYICWANQSISALGGRETRPASEIIAQLEKESTRVD